LVVFEKGSEPPVEVSQVEVSQVGVSQESPSELRSGVAEAAAEAAEEVEYQQVVVLLQPF
tara:strand:+ start:437 stop:616 length:180 start_codon:yes stop_codon:yes gene_type:complete